MGMKGRGKGSMEALVQELVESQRRNNERDFSDPEERAEFAPKTRAPATAADIAELAAYWRRPVPPSYAEFLKVSDGVENVESLRLLGTRDIVSGWAQEQIAGLCSVWDEVSEGFRSDNVLPIMVPGPYGAGIRHFYALQRFGGAEPPVIDWDDGEAFEEHPSFRALLESLARGTD